MEIDDKNYELSEKTPLELASNVHGLLAVKKDGSAGAVGLEEIANEAGKKVGDAVKIVGNVLPTDATVNKTAKVFGGTAGKTLTFTGGSVVIKPNYESNLIFDAVTKIWSIQDEVAQLKGADGKTPETFNSAKPAGYLAGDQIYFGASTIYSALVNVPMGQSPTTNPEKWKLELESKPPINNLTSTLASSPLSANMGRLLRERNEQENMYPLLSYTDVAEAILIQKLIKNISVTGSDLASDNKILYLGRVIVAGTGAVNRTFTIYLRDTVTGIDTSIINYTIVSGTTGLFDLTSILTLGRIVSVTIDATVAFQFTVPYTGSINYPLAQRFKNHSSFTEQLLNGSVSVNNRYNFQTDLIERTFKKITINGGDMLRYYAVFNLVTSSDTFTFQIYSYADAAKTLDGKRHATFTLSGSITGMQTVTATGSNGVVSVTVIADFTFLQSKNPTGVNYANLFIYNYAVDVISSDYLVEGRKFTGQLTASIPIAQRVDDNRAAQQATSSVVIMRRFFQAKQTDGIKKYSFEGLKDFVEEKGTYRVQLATVVNTAAEIGSINSYLSNVNCPFLPNVPQIEALGASFRYREPFTQEYVHPEIKDLGVQLGGYRYWMITSCYPSQSSVLEDELIFVSNDLASWKRIRGATEVYNAEIHAVGLSLPPQNLKGAGSNKEFMLLPCPEIGDSLEVNGEIKTIGGGSWSHDPSMYHDGVNNFLYFYITRNMKFVGDATPDAAPFSNQFNILIRFDGTNWHAVRNDGSLLPLNTAENSSKIYSQTGGKNNYLRHRDHLPEEKGSSIVKMGNEIWLMHGSNGSMIYKGTEIWNVNFLAGTPTTIGLGNHPTHFVFNSILYRHDNRGLSSYSSATGLFTAMPNNPLLMPFRGENMEYKRCISISPDGTALFAIVEWKDCFFNPFETSTVSGSNISAKMVIGKINNVAQFIANATTLKRGFYLSGEVYVANSAGIKVYRNPFIIPSGTQQTKYTLFDISCEKGDKIWYSIQVTGHKDSDLSISNLIISKI